MPDPFGGNPFGSMMAGLQQNLANMQANAESAEFEGQAGGGMVRVTASAVEVKRVRIDPRAMEDREMLEDLLVAALNDAQRKAREHVTAQTMGMMSNMGLPPDLLEGLMPKR